METTILDLKNVLEETKIARGDDADKVARTIDAMLKSSVATKADIAKIDTEIRFLKWALAVLVVPLHIEILFLILKST